MTRLFRLALATAVATFALILLGGVTATHRSGSGCADDWPLCDGRPYPPFDAIAVVEYLHRVTAVSVALLAVLTAAAAWRTAGAARSTRLASAAGVVLIAIQGALGLLDARWDLPSGVATAHLGLAVLFFAATLGTTVFAAAGRGAPAWLAELAPRIGAFDRVFARVAALAAVMTFLLILSGGVSGGRDGALACDAWPWCTAGSVVPGERSDQTWIELSHRSVALIGAATVSAVFWQAMRRPVARAARRMAEVALGLTVVELLIGGAYVVTSGSALLDTAHLAAATLLWAAMLGVALAARRPVESPAPPLSGGELGLGPLLPAGSFRSVAGEHQQVPAAVGFTGSGALAVSPAFAFLWPRRALARAGEYVALTKPGILTLLLATTLGGMLAGEAGLPPLGLVVATLIGGALAAGGANALNCYIDRDIDALMNRTRRRGTATGAISPRAALTFGLTLSVSAVLLLGVAVNWLAAGLALLGNVYYVLIYTKLLKRRTPQNIVIGGAAGAMPPVVGWAAATGEVTVAAVLMFAIIYYWTPPHFWALALLKQGEYGRAAVPMLPNVRGEEETRWQVLLYTIMLAAVSLMLAPFGMDWIYLAGAAALNALFVWYAVRLYRSPSKALARRMFFYSLWYLALIFAAMVADRIILA
jgi:protoheme IX farnesyltransferase